MTTLRERITEVMTAKGWEHSDLMRVSGQSSSVVSQWLGKGSKIIKTIGKIEAAQAIEAASGFSALWVAKGIGPKFAEEPKVPIAHDMSQAQPIVTARRLAWEGLMRADLDQPFELVVVDDALAPEIAAGCVARFDPPKMRAPVAGRPVLVRDKDGAHYLRDYQQAAAGRWQAVARQRGFAVLDSAADGLAVVGVMRGYDWP